MDPKERQGVEKRYHYVVSRCRVPSSAPYRAMYIEGTFYAADDEAARVEAQCRATLASHRGFVIVYAADTGRGWQWIIPRRLPLLEALDEDRRCSRSALATVGRL